MRHHCLAISCGRLAGPFPAAQMSVQVGQRRDRSVGLSLIWEMWLRMSCPVIG